jgi:NAD(P)-dependent dehydrogenase (short-subunit alcohol dehydrogenase family)
VPSSPAPPAGIGIAGAAQLAAEGATVIVNGRTTARFDEGVFVSSESAVA